MVSASEGQRFCMGECGRLLEMSVKYLVKLVFRNGIVLQPADRVGRGETGTFRRKSFLLVFRRQHLVFEGHSYPKAGQMSCT